MVFDDEQVKYLENAGWKKDYMVDDRGVESEYFVRYIIEQLYPEYMPGWNNKDDAKRDKKKLEGIIKEQMEKEHTQPEYQHGGSQIKRSKRKRKIKKSKRKSSKKLRKSSKKKSKSRRRR